MTKTLRKERQVLLQLEEADNIAFFIQVNVVETRASGKARHRAHLVGERYDKYRKTTIYILDMHTNAGYTHILYIKRSQNGTQE